MKTQPPVRQFLVEELAAGWIPDERRSELLGRLADEGGGADRLAEIARSNEEILDRYPPRLITAQIEQRYRESHRSSRSSLRFVLPALATAAAAAVLVWIILPGGTRHSVDPAKVSAVAEEHILVKGAPQLVIHRLQGARVERLRPGQTVAAGDLLQLEYNAAEARYGVVFSVDGRGSVALHYPSSAGEPTELSPGGARALPFSYELDDAPGFERFFLVWSNSPIPVDAVLAAANGLGSSRTARLVLPSGLDSVEYLLLKRPSGRQIGRASCRERVSMFV
jgi:hypothetical protein